MKEKKQKLKFGLWFDVVDYICNTNNDFLYLGMISRSMDTYYATVYNIIKQLEEIGLVKTKRVGNIRKIIEIKPACYELAEHVRKIKEVINNATKPKRTSTNRKIKS